MDGQNTRGENKKISDTFTQKAVLFVLFLYNLLEPIMINFLSKFSNHKHKAMYETAEIIAAFFLTNKK